MNAITIRTNNFIISILSAFFTFTICREKINKLNWVSCECVRKQRNDLIRQCCTRSAEINCAERQKMWFFYQRVNPAFKWYESLKGVFIFRYFSAQIDWNTKRFVYNFFYPHTKVLSPVDSIHYKSFLFFHFRSFSSSFAELIEFSSLSLRFPYRTAQSALFISFFTTVSSYRALIQGGKIHCGFPMFR